MGGRWLLDLPDWISAAGLDVDVYPGWERKSRASGGYDAVLAVGTHHTAGSGRYPKADMDWMWKKSPYTPVGAIYLGTKGQIVVGAAGATNTQGKGGEYRASRGLIPKNQGNRFVLSIEAANAGTGVVWPDAQIEAYIDLCAVLCSRLNLIPAQDIMSHHTWAPGRKSDPSGPTPGFPSLGGTDGNVSWPDAAFADLVAAKTAPDPTPNVSVVPRPVLRVGSRGPDVAKLIDILKWCKWYPAPYIGDHNDGVYGQRTTAGVSVMQRYLSVTETGVYDEPSAAALEHLILYGRDNPDPVAPPPCQLPPPSKPGDSGQSVIELQHVLTRYGWYPYRVDGSYGRMTQIGVQKMQRETVRLGHNPGPIDGWYGKQTRTAACASTIS